MRVVAISKDGNFYKIGVNEGQAKWYGIGEQVKKFIGSIEKGDNVNIRYQTGSDGKPVLTFVRKLAGGEPSPEPEPTNGPGGNSAPPAPRPTGGYGYKDPAVQESIKRQAIGHMTSRTLIALQGLVTVENVTGMMENLYAKYQELVG